MQLDHIDTVIKEDDSDYDEFVCIEDDAADDSLEISWEVFVDIIHSLCIISDFTKYIVSSLH